MDHILAKTILITKVIEIIASKKHISLKLARDMFYNSSTIMLLNDDKTSLYSQSPLYIYSLFEKENK